MNFSKLVDGHQVRSTKIRQGRFLFVTHLTPSQFDFLYEPWYNIHMKTKRTPEQQEAIKRAFWNKWGGGDPNKVIRTKGITKDAWYIQDITNATPKNVTNTTPSELDNTITKGV